MWSACAPPPGGCHGGWTMGIFPPVDGEGGHHQAPGPYPAHPALPPGTGSPLPLSGGIAARLDRHRVSHGGRACPDGQNLTDHFFPQNSIMSTIQSTNLCIRMNLSLIWQIHPFFIHALRKIMILRLRCYHPATMSHSLLLPAIPTLITNIIYINSPSCYHLL